jgi:hypothetical protein
LPKTRRRVQRLSSTPSARVSPSASGDGTPVGQTPQTKAPAPRCVHRLGARGVPNRPNAANIRGSVKSRSAAWRGPQQHCGVVWLCGAFALAPVHSRSSAARYSCSSRARCCSRQPCRPPCAGEDERERLQK